MTLQLRAEPEQAGTRLDSFLAASVETLSRSAAQQRYGDYMRQMTEKIPALYKLAYEMYADEAGRDLADLGAIRALDADAYGRWKDGYGHLGDLYTRAAGERSYADARADKAAEEARAERLLAERLRRGRL